VPVARAAAGDAFRAHADKYLRSWLSKGAPSLFTMVRKLYADPAKGAVLHSLLDGYLANLRGKPSRFASNGATPAPCVVPGGLRLRGHS